MNLTTEHQQDVDIVRVKEARMMYPLLSEFSTTVTSLIQRGGRKVVIDLSAVGYVDSATIGCFMDLYRQMSAVGGSLKLSGVQRRVVTMLTMTGAQNFIDMHDDEASALASFRGERHAQHQDDDRAADSARRRPDVAARDVVRRGNGAARARADVRGHDEGDHAISSRR